MHVGKASFVMGERWEKCSSSVPHLLVKVGCAPSQAHKGISGKIGTRWGMGWRPTGALGWVPPMHSQRLSWCCFLICERDQRILSVLGDSFCSCPTLSVLYPVLSCLALVTPLHIHRWAQRCLVVAELVFMGLCGHFVQCVATGLALGMPGHVIT